MAGEGIFYIHKHLKDGPQNTNVVQTEELCVLFSWSWEEIKIRCLLYSTHKSTFSYSHPVAIFVVINEGECTDKSGACTTGMSYPKSATLDQNWPTLSTSARPKCFKCCLYHFLQLGFVGIHYYGHTITV